VLVPNRFPSPEAPDFGRAVSDVLGELARRTGRKTMGLFTSYRLVAETARELAAAGLGGTGGDATALLVQEPGGSAAALASRFRRLARAVLLGTATFWEGVDFPGDDLEILVVTKLPFLVPSDPWVEARCQRLEAAGENAFTSFMVRDAVLRLRQGCGRLIRRPDDRGVVIVLDTRLHTRSYGTTFLNALPAMPAGFGDTADLLDRVQAFFARETPRKTGPGGRR
jgi:ATP-dependent DNA helicase DinG